MKKDRVSVNYLYNLAYQILLFITPIITAPYLARHFGSESLGVYNYTYSIVYWFVLLGMLGLNIYGNRQIAKVSDDREKRSKIFSEIFTLQLINVIVSTTIFYLVFRFFDHQYFNIFLVQGILIFSSLFDISWFYNGIENFKKITTRNFIVKILTVSLIFIFIKSPEQIMDFVWLNVGMTIFSNLVMWINIKKYIDFKRSKIKDALKHFKKTFLLFLPQVATSIYCIFTQTMIGLIYHNIGDVAFYNQAYNLIIMCLSVTTTIGLVMLPRIVNNKAKEGDEVVRKSTNKTFKIGLFLSVPIAIGIGTGSLYFIPWFLTEEFMLVGYILAIMAPMIIFVTLSNVLGTQYLLSMDKDKQYTISTVLGCVINIIINLILITKFGAIGAAISTVTTEFIVLAIQYFMVAKTFDFSGILTKIIKYILVASVMGITIFIIGYFMGPNLITNIVQFVCGGLIYFIILYILKDDILLFFIQKLREILPFSKKV